MFKKSFSPQKEADRGRETLADLHPLWTFKKEFFERMVNNDTVLIVIK